MVSSALKYRVKTERQRASKRKDIRKEWEQKEAKKEKIQRAQESRGVLKKAKKGPSQKWVTVGAGGKAAKQKKGGVVKQPDRVQQLLEASKDVAGTLSGSTPLPSAPQGAPKTKIDLSALGTMAAMMDDDGAEEGVGGSSGPGRKAEDKKEAMPGWGEGFGDDDWD